MYEKMKQCAEFLGNTEVLQRIENLENMASNENYILSFIGQFSVGKSRLINNIIGRDILPTNISPTTAVITFLKYGPENCAVIYYNDDSYEKVEQSELKNIWQKGKSSRNLSNISYIDVLIDDPLFKNGLIIADTPGINALKAHDEITLNLMDTTEEIIYIFSKQVSETDKIFLKNNIQSGTNVSFVRTYCDAFDETEENEEDSITAELKILADEIGASKMFFVSNIKANSYYKNISRLRDYIDADIAKKADERLKNCIKVRAEQLWNGLEKSLNSYKEKLVSKKENKESELQKELDKQSSRRESFNSYDAEVNNETDRKIKAAYEDGEKRLSDCKEKHIKKSQKQLDNIDYGNNVEEKISDILNQDVKAAYDDMRKEYITPFNGIISEINESAEDILKNTDGFYADVVNVFPSDIEGIMQSMKESNDIIRYINEKLSELEKNDTKPGAKTFSEDELKELEETVSSSRINLDQLAPYAAKYIECEAAGIQPSAIMKRLGQGIDILTLLLPGEAFVQAAGVVGKVGANAGKIISSVDKTRDVMLSLKWGAEKLNAAKKTVAKEKPDLLDMLTAEYWLETLGKCFDKPPQQIEDEEYKNEYESRKRKLEAEYTASVNKLMAEKKKKGRYESEEAERKDRTALNESMKQQMKEQLRQEESNIREEAKKQVFAKLKKSGIEQFEKILDSLEANILDETKEQIRVAVERYKEAVVAELDNTINDIESSFAKIEDKIKALDSDELSDEITKCDDFKKDVREELCA